MTLLQNGGRGEIAFLGMNGVVGEGRGVKKLENWGDGP